MKLASEVYRELTVHFRFFQKHWESSLVVLKVLTSFVYHASMNTPIQFLSLKFVLRKLICMYVCKSAVALMFVSQICPLRGDMNTCLLKCSKLNNTLVGSYLFNELLVLGTSKIGNISPFYSSGFLSYNPEFFKNLRLLSVHWPSVCLLLQNLILSSRSFWPILLKN